MAATIDGDAMVSATAELVGEARLEAAAEPFDGERQRAHAPLPWIGKLPNPHLGPMLVINDSGLLVPLCTAVDFLRGCRYFWRVARD